MAIKAMGALAEILDATGQSFSKSGVEIVIGQERITHDGKRYVTVMPDGKTKKSHTQILSEQNLDQWLSGNAPDWLSAILAQRSKRHAGD
jgi:hypothetical protein